MREGLCFRPFRAASFSRSSQGLRRGLYSVAASRLGSALEVLLRIQKNGDRAFIDELHGHHSLKDSGRNGNAKAPQSFAELFIELPGKFRRSGGDEAWAALAARVAALAENFDVLRVKGFAAVAGKALRLLVQAVGPRVTHQYDRPWTAAEPRESRLVVIGLKGLDRAAVTHALVG